MSEYVVPFIHIFSEKEKEPPKLAKSPQPPRAEKLYLQRKKIHQNSVTSRRSYLANLRQQMLLGKKLTPEIIPQANKIHRVMPNLKTNHKRK